MTRTWKATYDDGEVAVFAECALLDRLACPITGKKPVSITPLRMEAEYVVPSPSNPGHYIVIECETGTQPAKARKIEGSEREVEE